MNLTKKFISIAITIALLSISITASAQYNFEDGLSEDNQNILRKLESVDPNTTQTNRTFTKPEVKANTQLMIVWGDISQNVKASAETESSTATLSISTDMGRVLALRALRKERNDHLISNRIATELKIASKLKGGVDGAIIVINDEATELKINFPELSSETFVIATADISEEKTEFTNEDQTLGLFIKELPKRTATTLNDANFQDRKSFNDTQKDQWYHKYVETVSEKRIEGKAIFEGYKNPQGEKTGNFGPADNLRLGELIKIALTVGGHQATEDNLDSSLENVNHWSKGYLNTGKKLNLRILKKTNLDPNRFVTRGEFFQTILEATGVVTPDDIEATMEACNYSKLEAFQDYDKSNKFTLAACILVQDGAISGTTDGYLRLSNKINRAEVAKVVIEVLAKYKEQQTEVENEIKTITQDLDDETEATTGTEDSTVEVEAFDGSYSVNGSYTAEDNQIYLSIIGSTSNLPEGLSTDSITRIYITNQNAETYFGVDYNTEVPENCSYGSTMSVTIDSIMKDAESGIITANVSSKSFISAAEVSCS